MLFYNGYCPKCFQTTKFKISLKEVEDRDYVMVVTMYCQRKTIRGVCGQKLKLTMSIREYEDCLKRSENEADSH